MNRFIALYFFLLCPFLAHCQEPTTSESQEPIVDSQESTGDGYASINERGPKIKFTAGYFGETVTHPGIVLGIEYYPYANDKYQMVLATNAGGYMHVRNNTSLFLRIQWGQRTTFKSGVFIDQFIGLGYLHHFVSGGKVFEVLPNGAVVSIPNNGRPMVMPSVAVGTGYNLKRSTGINLTIYLRPELFWKAPFNGYYLTHFALNGGFIFKLTGK